MKPITKIFIISAVVGYIFELYMTRFWQYDQLTYVLGVPIGIVLVWAVVLTLGYLFIQTYEKKTKIPFHLDLLILYIPVIIVVEFIGTNVLGWQINQIFPPLIGNFMKAPIVIYFAYYFVVLFTYKKVFPSFNIKL